jgi:uncharacterized protein (TIGR03435 family)
VPARTLVASLVALAFCAHPAAQPATFDVASIKRTPPIPPNPFGFPVAPSIRLEPGGRFTASRATLRDLLRFAYELETFLIQGGPEWMASDRFEVVARAASPDAEAPAIRAMVRTLLAERFTLRTHIESRELPVFNLVMARNDGRPGPALKPSTIECASVRARRGPAPAAPRDASQRSCEIAFDMNGGIMTVGLEGASIAELLRGLVTETRRPVVDRTGLAGTFDGQLTFKPEPLPGFPPLPGSVEGISVFTALQEQFGLKLEAGRSPVDVLIVDGAAPPSED